jgi:ElaB/YqjD/DUF883 family membrane-anchored ribosome-binding protein
VLLAIAKARKMGEVIMVDKNMTDAARNVAASARQAADAAKDYAVRGIDVAREYGGTARDYANTGMDVAARTSENLTEFVRNEPWIAMAAAFAVGYVAARLMRRLSI